MGVTKVFRIELKGGSAVEKDISGIKDQMRLLGIEADRVRSAISGVTGTPDTKKVADLKLKLADLEKQMVSLNQQRSELVNGAQKEAQVNDQLGQQATTRTGDFLKLNQQYKEAKINAQDLAAKYGVESEQALAAARSAALLKDQLFKINTLIKTGTIPLTSAAENGTNKTDASVATAEAAAIAAKEEDQAMISLAKSEQYLAEQEQFLAGSRESASLAGNQRTEVIKDELAANEQVAASLSNVSTKYEEYTGTLRANQIAQYENETALTANLAEQKVIQKEITTTGVATAEQTSRMEVLREEEVLLIETNKALSITIRNQAKEFLAAGGSLDEAQAQLNQLQQAYQQLTDQERAQPFGQNMKAEIDILEPKVKALEYELGIFGRNVGNYPQAYTKAFKVLEAELDTVKGKLVKGNFAGADLAQLAKQEQVLTQATASLGATYTTTTQRQNALKESARQIGLVYGTDSIVFKNFATQVSLGNAELKKTDSAIVAATSSGSKFSKGLSSIFGGLRKIAYAIPGIGLAGLIGLLLAPLGALASSMFDYATQVTSAGKATQQLNKIYEDTKNDIHETSDEFANAVSLVEKLTINVDLAKKGFLNKDQVLRDYNETLGKTTGQVSSLDEAEKALVRNGDAYIQMTLLKAAANIALENAAKKAFEAEETSRKRLADFSSTLETIGAGLSETGPDAAKIAAIDKKQIEESRAKRRQQLVDEAKKDEQEQIDIAKKFQSDAAKIAKDFGFNFFPDQKDKKERKKLSDFLQDALRLIEEARLRAVALENNRFNEIQKDHEATFDEEREHLTKIEKINIDAFNKKITLFQSQKKLNAEEKRTLAEFLEQRSATQLKYNKDLAEIDKKEFERKQKDLKNELDATVNSIKAVNDAIQGDASVSNVDKAKAQIKADNDILAAEQLYYQKLLTLNKKYNKDALAQATEAISALQLVIARNRKLLYEGAIKDIADASGLLSDEFKERLAQATTNILTSNLSPRQQAAALLKVQEDAQDILLANQVAALKREVDEKKKAVDQKLISEKEYQDKLAEYRTAEANALQRNIDKQLTLLQRFRNALKDFGTDFKETVLGIKSYTKDAAGDTQKVADAFNAGLTGIKTAINSAYQTFFQAEANKIDKQKQSALDFEDRQKQQLLAVAQSEEEKATIERKSEQARAKIEKQAAEAKKKLALKQATIDFAVAAIKTFATYGFPLGLIALAGLTAAYLAERAAINQQTFAGGGKVMPERMSNGLIRRSGNIPVQSNGDNILATVRTGEVILNKRQQNALGGYHTFKSIGVPGFATGGIGSSLKPPVFTASSFSNSAVKVDDSRIQRLEAMTAQVLSAVYASDAKEVKLVTGKVTKAQKRNSKDVSLATI